MENTEGTDDGTKQKTTERDGTDGNSYRTHGKGGGGREQAGMSGEGRRMMEKVLENTVRDRHIAILDASGPTCMPAHHISTRVCHPLSTLLVPLRLKDEQSSRCIVSRAICMLFILTLFFY